jgi:putative transposase
MARNYVFAPGEYYHLYARGVEKVHVYREEADYKRFLEGVYLCNSKQAVDIRAVKNQRNPVKGLTFDEMFGVERVETLVDIGAYCLMPNHFHLLVHEKMEGGISKFMQKLMTSYTMYVNKKYDRTGSIFGSSFKARHVTDDTHLKYLFAYIHLNPKEIVGNNLEGYMHSSYQDYVGSQRPQTTILNRTAFPNYFTGNMKKELAEWITGDASEVYTR